MQSISSELQRDKKIKYLVAHASSGALVYLILPFYTLVRGSLTWDIVALSSTITILAFLRFSWANIFYKNHHESPGYLMGFYSVASLLAFSASLLAWRTLGPVAGQGTALFNTVFIATMTSGVMTAFAAEPKMAAFLGGIMLFPFSLGLILIAGTEGWWIGIGSVFYHIWNMVLVRRTHNNYVRLQDSERFVAFQEARLKQFINSLPGYVAWFDNELNYLDANESLVDLLGVKRDELMGKNLGFPRPHDPMVNRIREFKNSNKSYEIVETATMIKGTSKDLLVMLLRYRLDKAEEQMSVLGLDVTSLREQERELEKRRLHLLAQEKFAALGEVAGGIAHEINNPLAIILGKVDVLLMQSEKEVLNRETLERQLRSLSNTSKRVIGIVKSLKTLVREGRISHLEKTSIASVIDPLQEMLNSRLESLNVHFMVNRQNFDVVIQCGVVEIGQVLMNLVINAAQAVEDLDEKWVKLEVQFDETKVYLVISDSGRGLLPEVQKKLFQPFFTTKGSGSGTGLGLSLSKELMRKQDGDLYYREGERHTTFVIEVPRIHVHQGPTSIAA